MFTAELRRSILGLPNHVLIRHRKKGHTVKVFEFAPSEPLYLTMPEWVLYRDWTDELVVFSDLGISGELVELLASHPSGVAPPAAWVADCNAPLVDEIPCRAVRYLPGERGGPELGLAFVQPGVRAMVRDQDAVECVADHIIGRSRDTDPIAYLHTVLQKPWVTAAAADKLTEVVASRLGKDAAALIARSGATDRVLPYTIRGKTYLCRNGIYVKRRGKGDWQPCTNFSLRIEESSVGGDGADVAHRLLLLMDGASAEFTVSERELHDGAALLGKASATAISEWFPALPRVLDPADLGRLPNMVMATQLKPAIISELPPVSGFDRGRFHGSNFTATPKAVSFRSPDERVSSMLPEDPWEPPDDHLACRANELAAWLDALAPAQRRMASAVIHAALAWLHRGSRGLPSYLLLPSDAHIDLLGALTGVVPIDVGHERRTHFGMPLMMRSSYSKPDQFGRHGRVVAALEDRHRKIHGGLPVLVHDWAGDEVPSPPAGILSLLTHSVLGARDLGAAVGRFTGLVECPEARGRFQSHLEEGAGYLADSGRYLDTFIAALHRLPDLGDYVIRRGDEVLLEREVVKRLNGDLAFGFRETRLIDELRARFNLAQPGRYGRKQVPVFRLPEDALATG